ncbi:hypothetical protein D3C72_710260 [compost metagenome]
MKKFAFAAAAAAVMLGTAPAAFAGEQDFTIHNKTGMEIVELYVEASSSEEWGDELLGEEALENGGSSEISFDGYEDECKFDIWLKDSKGGKWEVKGVDLCKIHEFTVTKKGSGLAWSAN